MALAHSHVKEDLQIESQTGRISLQILATFVGGVLLLTALAAKLIYDSPAHADVLAALAAILLGLPLVWVAVQDLWHGHAHMNELVALGVVAAFAQGWYAESAAIAFFMVLSVLIENRTALGARASIESLVRITPTRAQRLAPDGLSEAEVEARDLHPGDTIRVRPGDNIPADGQVLRGTSTVNQATITGESLPADKAEGDEVFGGTINLTGMLDIAVTKAGADTTLGRVKDLILQAERTRIPIARMIDRYATWYTPTVLMLAGMVLFFSYKGGLPDPWERTIAMLVLACPCALILATPTAMVASLSAAARLGVLVKSVADLEAARNLTAMIFDKTGTLTTGQLQVTRLAPVDGVAGADLLRVAATAEQHSKHPVARAVLEVARKARLALPATTSFEEVPGRGVIAEAATGGSGGGGRVLVGRANWVLGSHAADLKPGAAAAITAAQDSPQIEGLSVLFVIQDGGLLGWIGLEDNTRPEAAAAIDQLRGLGLRRVIIVTGDRESVARRVAAQMHTEYRAEVLPQQKLEMVDQLKAAGHRVAVVGDGVNDAPALAAGDISIALGAAGSDVAIHSANIALMNNNLNRIPFLIQLSRQTSNVIRQNLAFGILFIVVGLTAAAFGHIPVIVAAMLHLGSGLVVVFNSARLVRAGEQIEAAEARALAHATPPAQAPAPAGAATPAPVGA